MKKPAIITICGDLCPSNDTEAYFKTGDHRQLFTDCLSLFEGSDVVMGNLEFPLTDEGRAIKKTGPILKGETRFIEVFKKAGFNVLGLANNHIKDCGPEGVESTMRTCTENAISIVGAGENLAEAKKPLIKKVNGWKIGIMAFAEQEFNIASETEAGANYLDLFDDFDAIKKFREEVDYLILLYHGGIEYYEYPSPLLQKKCRKLIDSGADLVTCQHSHCIGTEEGYNKGTIIYGQGNTLFGYREGNNSWNEGLVLKVTLSENESPKLDYIPISATALGIKITEIDKAAGRLEAFFKDSEHVKNAAFIKESWMKFCNKKKPLYMPLLFGFNRVFIHANRILKNGLVKKVFSRNKLRVVTNILRCEAHKEVLDTIFQNEINTNKH